MWQYSCEELIYKWLESGSAVTCWKICSCRDLIMGDKFRRDKSLRDIYTGDKYRMDIYKRKMFRRQVIRILQEDWREIYTAF